MPSWFRDYPQVGVIIMQTKFKYTKLIHGWDSSISPISDMDVLQIPLLNQAKRDGGLKSPQSLRDLTLVNHNLYNSKTQVLCSKVPRSKSSQCHQLDASLPSLPFLSTSKPTVESGGEWPASHHHTLHRPGKAEWVKAVNPGMQVPAPGVGHLSFRGHSLRSHKIATAIWAKCVSSLMTQDSFSKFRNPISSLGNPQMPAVCDSHLQSTLLCHQWHPRTIP